MHILLWRYANASSLPRGLFFCFACSVGLCFLSPGEKRMGNTDRRGPEISDGWQGTSDDGVESGSPLKVAVIGAGVAGLGEAARACVSAELFIGGSYSSIQRWKSLAAATRGVPVCHQTRQRL